MFERMAGLGATEIQLELALDGAEIDSQSLDFLGAATRSFRFISGFSANRMAGVGRLPLNLLAKYNVSAAQLEQESHSADLVQIIAQLAEQTLDWFSKGMSDLKISPGSYAGKHLQLRWAMEKRRLQCNQPQYAADYLKQVKASGRPMPGLPGDSFGSWGERDKPRQEKTGFRQGQKGD